jgi:two-component system, response regulator PdtaR
VHALIIEQDAWITEMIEDTLREIGYTSFQIAASGEEAKVFAEKRCPDIITSDVRLGTADGIATVRTICAAAPIPVVFITATSWEVREHDPGLAVVQKPFRPVDLKTAVKRAIPYPDEQR